MAVYGKMSLLHGKSDYVPPPAPSEVPGNLDYYAKSMVTNAGVPDVFLTVTDFKTLVFNALRPRLESIQSDKLLTELLRMAGHTCTREVIAENYVARQQRYSDWLQEIDELKQAKKEDEVSEQEKDLKDWIEPTIESTVLAIARILSDGFTAMEKGLFVFNSKGQIVGLKDTDRARRFPKCNRALQAGEYIDAIDAGSARRRKRKTVKRRRMQRKTKRNPVRR